MLAKLKNMGSVDSIIRYIIAVIAAAAAIISWQLGFWSPGLIIAGAVIVLIMALTATIKVCPLYLPFGFRTNKK